MIAPRELDTLVAHRVMGWGITALNTTPHGGGENQICGLRHDTPGVSLEHPEWNTVYRYGIADRYEIPHYSTDIATAWEVVEKLKGDGHFFNIMDVMGSDHWVAEFHGKGASCLLPGSGSCATADTVPIAICLAALAAVGHKFENTTPATGDVSTPEE